MESKQEKLLNKRNAELEKQLAQKNRDLEVEAALERVRARTMAMQRSEELAETAFILFKQFKELGENPDQATIGIINEAEHVIEYWVTMYGSQINKMFKFSIDEPNVTHKIYKAWKAKKASLVIDLSGKALYDFTTYRASKGGAGFNPDEKRRVINVAFFSKGIINVQSTEARSVESVRLLERFAGVFDGTYTRFLDLQKAEAQAREAQIELSLERMRAKTMAMHTSQDVADTVITLFDELVKLGIENTARCGIAIIGDNQEMELWRASYNHDGKVDMIIGRIDMTIHPLLEGVYQAWKNKETVYSCELIGKNQEDYFQALNNSPEYPVQFDLASLPAKQTNNVFFFTEGCVYVFTIEPLSEDTVKLFKRFAGVFGLTYRRYLDLQKAEEQARESQIQLALERVRARTMAMQKSNELAETVSVLFKQLLGLGIPTEQIRTCGIVTFDAKEPVGEQWITEMNGDIIPRSFMVPYDEAPAYKTIYEWWKKGKEFEVNHIEGESLQEHLGYLAKYTKVPLSVLTEESSGIYNHVLFFSQGYLFIITRAAMNEYHDVFKRFGSVFQQSYTRFLDLQKAEAQAREAQIQLGLERVRAKAMAMQTSEELNELIGTVFTELTKLDFVLTRCLIMIFDPETNASRWWMANSEAPSEPMNYLVQDNRNPAADAYLKAWKERNLKWRYELKGKVKRDWDDFLFVDTELAQLPGPVIEGMKAPDRVLLSASFNNFGCLTLVTLEPLSDEHSEIMLRFAKVFDMSYTRFNDLQKAEAQAREAIKQASVDRVRGEIASMRSTNDLERITPLIWNELTVLDIPFIRCGVFIVDEQEQLIRTHLSTADGKGLATFNLKFDSEGIGQDVLPAWRNKQTATIHWSEEEFATYTKNLVDQGTVRSKERYVTEHPNTSLDLHFLPFLQGMLYVGNIAPLTGDKMNLVQSLADAFATAYARYEDFNKLESAKQQVENTLSDLKAAQTKLIQSEKMASLGELTAGIAHEIQNPLNFVNNFSEVNQEMIDELEEELRSGHIEEALAIAADIKQNEEKINHHGKRADGIVKGMLQHSRTGGGEKQPTNINALADEFLRLSYHGLRAKDKTFNAELVTHFDPDLPKINVIAQDIGRVMLNLFNNAFYAVNQKMKVSGSGYKPEVSVTTSSENGQVLIKVKDNGIGMPEHIKEKIMQPFFTTKPTGEGTGLGLSLTYDMVVKGHRGRIEVDTKEGQYTEFTVSLPL